MHYILGLNNTCTHANSGIQAHAQSRG